MASETVTLFLDGTPTLADYSAAVSAFADLINTITQRVAPSVEVTWDVDDLEAESALTTVRGISPDSNAVDRVAQEYLRVGRELRTHAAVSGYESATRKLRGILNGRVPVIKFETADDDVTIGAAEEAAPAVAPQGIVDYGAVEGRIQTLSNRGGLRFTLYDLLYDKAVSCYLAEGSELLMRDSWGRMALVEGLVKRDPVTGRPIAVRQVSNVTILEEGTLGAWRSAIGALSNITDGEPAEETIRRIRDAE